MSSCCPCKPLLTSPYDGKNLDEYDFSDSFIDDAAEEDDEEEESAAEDDDQLQDPGENLADSSDEEADSKKRIRKAAGKAKCVS